MDLIAIRHALHQLPEIAFEEHQTKAAILAQLKDVDDVVVHEFLSSPGILVEYTVCEGDYRLFRADMDALPITENTACEYQSVHQGMMHACGHDVHMTVLLGLIDHIAKTKPKRNLLFLFQPAEEGKGGAESVLAEGLIQQFPVSEVFALHVGSGLPVGSVSSREGIFFGIPQEFDVRFLGKSAHVAYPEMGVNALQAGVDLINAMKHDIEQLSQTERVIFHIGKMAAGNIRNVIADKCILEGTHRSLRNSVCHHINDLILKNCDAVAEANKAEYEVDFLCSYDPVINDRKLTQELGRLCAENGIEYIEAETAMTGEDFGFFTSRYPGLLFWLGGGCDDALHSDKFLPLDACVDIGVLIFAALATR
ncbi:MAG: amidohydrolase [Candidatus Cloacimonadaceae bacterium]|nr:amidohydrolase [Candidatus Cloacimonadaceae bacterium]